MSVLIKGMNLPKNCFECDFQNPFVDGPYCRRLLKRCSKTKRLEDCPLVEIPKPHGRLKDVERLQQEFEDSVIEGVLQLSTSEIISTIDDAPTVIEAEEGEDE